METTRRCVLIYQNPRQIPETAGAEAELQPPVRQEIDCRSLAGDEHRVAQIIVEDARADAETLGRLGGADEGRHRRDVVGKVVRQAERVVAKRLDPAGLLGEFRPRSYLPDAHAKSKWSHSSARLLRSAGSPPRSMAGRRVAYFGLSRRATR